ALLPWNPLAVACAGRLHQGQGLRRDALLVLEATQLVANAGLLEHQSGIVRPRGAHALERSECVGEQEIGALASAGQPCARELERSPPARQVVVGIGRAARSR